MKKLPAALVPLKKYPNWVIWRWVDSKKVPYQPNKPNRRARTNDPSTWATLEDAQAAALDADGLGFVLKGTPIAALDLDDCRDPKILEIDRWAEDLIRRAETYVEVTPGLHGLRIIGLAQGEPMQTLRERGRGKVEIYRDTERYITVTGDEIGHCRKLANIDDVIDELCALKKDYPEKDKSSSALFHREVAKFAKRGLSPREIAEAFRDNPLRFAKTKANQFHEDGRLEREVKRSYDKLRDKRNIRADADDAFGEMKDVVEERVKWLAKPYFVLGATTVLDGNPGQGKSTFVSAIAAAVTTGKKPSFLPDLLSGPVLILSAEDDPARVLKPRLLANGADVSLIRFQKDMFSLDEEGLKLLRDEIEEHRPILVVIDPLIAYMDSETDLNKANETMHFMVKIDLIAREFDVCILVIRHLRKSEASDPLYRGLGSIAIAARVRSALVLGRDPSDPDVRAIAQPKCSYAPEGDTILFEIVSDRRSQAPNVRWIGTDPDLKADDLLARPPGGAGRPSNEREDAKRFLLQFLADGPKSKSAVERAAAAHSISSITLRRASDDLEVQKKRKDRQSIWSLPPEKH